MKIFLDNPAGGVDGAAYILDVSSDMGVDTLNRRVNMVVYTLRKCFICLLLHDMRDGNIAANLLIVKVQPLRDIRQVNL